MLKSFESSILLPVMFVAQLAALLHQLNCRDDEYLLEYLWNIVDPGLLD